MKFNFEVKWSRLGSVMISSLSTFYITSCCSVGLRSHLVYFPSSGRHLGLHDGGDELLVFLDDHLEFAELIGPLVLGPLCHEDLQDVGQPLLHLSSLKVLAQGLQKVNFVSWSSSMARKLFPALKFESLPNHYTGDR